MDDATDRTHDVVVFGATGFTGRLVAEHLAARGDDAGDWAIAGRNPEKLARVARELDVAVPQLVVDASDHDQVATMAASTRVVCSTVGPYTRHGEPVVRACAESGTDYVDLTGEPQWIRRMIDRHHDTAVASGARIVHCCGFDSIPSDLGTALAQATMHDRHGLYASEVRYRLRAMRGSWSGGTAASALAVMEDAATDPAVADIVADPYSLLPAGERVGPHVRRPRGPSYDEAFSSWTAPFVMEMVNAKVVRRTNALLGYPWGREFHYQEDVLLGDGLRGRARATAWAAGISGAMRSMSSGTLTDLGARFLPDLLPESGDGPDADAREAGFLDVRIVATHPDGGEDVVVKVTTDRDPGYGATARMIGEAALTLAHGEVDVGGGSWTPASALGDGLRTRLEAHAGMGFEVQ